MTIDKDGFDKSLRRVRGLYRSHAKGELSPSDFATKARAELSALYMQHTRELVEATANRTIEELQSFQTQFGLDLDWRVNLFRVTRGFRGLRASVHIRNKDARSGSFEIFVGPFDEWNKIAVHTRKEREESWKGPSLYTKRKRNRWKNVQDFDFPALLQRMKEEAERPEPEDDEEIPF